MMLLRKKPTTTMTMSLRVLLLLGAAACDFVAVASSALYGREEEAKIDAVAVDRSVDLSRVAGERMEMRLAGDAGDVFTCVIPSDIRVDDVDEQRQRSEARDDVRTVSELRQLMTSMHESCLYRLEGWWSYEVCTARGSVRQFHAQDLTGLVHEADQHYLGSKRDESATILTADYLSETLLAGSYCDVSAQQRQTELRYKCDVAREASAILSIQEPQSCRYIVTIATPLICIHPHFAGLSRRSVNELRCQFSGANLDRAAHIDALIRELRLAAPPSATSRELSVHRDGIVGVSLADLTAALAAGASRPHAAAAAAAAATVAAAAAAAAATELPPPVPTRGVAVAKPLSVSDPLTFRLAGMLRSVVGLRIFNDRELSLMAGALTKRQKELAALRPPSGAAVDALHVTQQRMAFQNELINELAKSLTLSVERRGVLRQVAERVVEIAEQLLSTPDASNAQHQKDTGVDAKATVFAEEEEAAIAEQAKTAVE
jgi:protein OS-9